jgi:prepilin-type N-terminal cleavage/methylation domain-containing protein
MKKGFTLVELMMVMVVMALIASLATGAAVKSIKQAKEQRINATRGALEMALMNYRAYEGNWPTLEGDGSDSTNRVFKGKDNAQAFAPLLESTKKVYLDPSGLLTKPEAAAVKKKPVLSVREALENGIPAKSCPIGYTNPDKGSEFKYFTVRINLEYDTVKVER